MTDGSDEEETLAFEEFDYSSVEPEVPTVDVPEPDLAGRFEDSSADPETAFLFWRLVLVFDVALLALVVGLLLWFVEGRTVVGLQLSALGAVAFGYGVYRVRTRDTGDADSDEDGTADSTSGESEPGVSTSGEAGTTESGPNVDRSGR